MKYFKKAIQSFMIFFSILFNIATLIAQDYYPLEIGNQWVYKIEEFDPNVPPPYFNDTLEVIVTADTLINGCHYFVLDTIDLSGGKIVRADSNNIFYYDEYDSSEVLFYKLNAEINDSWITKLNGRNYKIKLASNYTKKYFGVLTTILRYEFDGAPWNFVEISKEFGIVLNVFSSGLQRHKRLLGCKLSNNYYGDVVSVDSYFKKIYTFELVQNYPNPFNSSTGIKYSLPQDNSTYQVTLKIYDIRGRLVNTLVNQNQAAGTYLVNWDGKDMNGQAVSSGVYFYTLQIDKFKTTNKMLLIR